MRFLERRHIGRARRFRQRSLFGGFISPHNIGADAPQRAATALAGAFTNYSTISHAMRTDASRTHGRRARHSLLSLMKITAIGRLLLAMYSLIRIPPRGTKTPTTMHVEHDYLFRQLSARAVHCSRSVAVSAQEDGDDAKMPCLDSFFAPRACTNISAGHDKCPYFLLVADLMIFDDACSPRFSQLKKIFSRQAPHWHAI